LFRSNRPNNDALRGKLNLLTPPQIQKGIERLGLQHQQLAERLGVSQDTVSSWVRGVLIQSRAMDNLLRVYFAFPEVREALRGSHQDPNLGTTEEDQEGQQERIRPASAFA
jgi:DNA-binding transcriptional regulator YiaG